MGAEDDGNLVILRRTGKAGDASLRLQIGGGYQKMLFSSGNENAFRTRSGK